MGKADGEAAAIYSEAYNQNSESRDFYSFIKTMETYKTTFSDKDWLILSTKGDFYRYLQSESVK
jgi:membrane protease subunit HflC